MQLEIGASDFEQVIYVRVFDMRGLRNITSVIIHILFPVVCGIFHFHWKGAEYCRCGVSGESFFFNQC